MKQLIILVYGEMLLLIATAALAGLIVVTLASSLIDINLRIDGVTVLVILGIMTALSGICLIPLTFQMKRYMPTDMLRGVYPVIELNNVCKSYGHGENETQVLKNVNVMIHRSECVAIMGSSGAGKTSYIYWGFLIFPVLEST
nr:hypothetical protein [Paenibacillus sp. OSY-SE]